jgi:hypothetical protein
MMRPRTLGQARRWLLYGLMLFWGLMLWAVL